MNKRALISGLVAMAILAGHAAAQTEVPLSTAFTYQGQLKNSGTVVDGTADFQFTLWDSLAAGVQVAGPVAVNNVGVADGLFTTSIDFGVAPFNGENRYLQIAVRSPAGVGAFTTITRRQLLSATPYALQTRGLFTDAGLNVGVGGAPLSKFHVFGDLTVRDRAIFSPATTPVITTGMNNVNDKRMWMSHSLDFPNWGIQYRDFGSDGFPADTIEFLGGNQTQPRIGIQLFPGTMTFFDGTGNAVNNRLVLDSTGSGGTIDSYNGAGLRTAYLMGNNVSAGGEFGLANQAGTTIIRMGNGLGTGGGGTAGITLFNPDGTIADGMRLQVNNGGGSSILLYNSAGARSVDLSGDSVDGGAADFYQANGTNGVEIRGSESSATGGQIRLFKADGTATIEIDADFNGDGRIITNELQITGGSDLSEQFNITSPVADMAVEPGYIVSINPAKPGDLVISSKAYDKTVAGIISGAGGVKPGLYMGQKGTKADGRHAVALTGRVYCYVDATENAVEAGDLLTTSATAGYAMKAVDHAQSQGAVIGKAMTALKKGEKGLVLVLVNLQ